MLSLRAGADSFTKCLDSFLKQKCPLLMPMETQLHRCANFGVLEGSDVRLLWIAQLHIMASYFMNGSGYQTTVRFAMSGIESYHISII